MARQRHGRLQPKPIFPNQHKATEPEYCPTSFLYIFFGNIDSTPREIVDICIGQALTAGEFVIRLPLSLFTRTNCMAFVRGEGSNDTRTGEEKQRDGQNSETATIVAKSLGLEISAVCFVKNEPALGTMNQRSH